LYDIEKDIGKPLTAASAMAAVQDAFSEGSISESYTCSRCAQAAFNVFKADKPELAAKPIVTDFVTKQCGADFLSKSLIALRLFII